MQLRGDVMLLCLAVAGCGGAAKGGGDAGGTMDAAGDGAGPMEQNGLSPQDNGQIVFDSSQGVYWLADANLAGDPTMRAQMGVGGINPNGTMDYEHAQMWVKALNAFMGGSGYLGHNNWQLPVTPPADAGCSSNNVNDFGVACKGSALGNLYSVGLGRAWPQSAVPGLTTAVAPLQNLQPSLHWTLDGDASGEHTFSFGTDTVFSNTTKFNYFHVLPMVQGAIGTKPKGPGIVPYSSGPAMGKAVYDTAAQVTWPLDANLAASNDFGEVGTTTVTGTGGRAFTAPLVDAGSGTMLFATAGDWVSRMKQGNYAGANNWSLPHDSDLQTLFTNLGLQIGDSRLIASDKIGPFTHLQPFFYWACMRDQTGSSRSPCNGADAGKNGQGITMEWSFNFEDGFQGTDEHTKQFFVLVYYAAGK